jgi:S1-C subfamily serine protease
VEFYPVDLGLADVDLVIQPSEAVSIIGFPFGFAATGRLAIWKTGHVASDIDVNYDGKPAFLIDATTRSGMSGSPVVALRVGMWRTSQGVTMSAGQELVRFLGTYSGRIHVESEIGTVWKAETLQQILA